jgi:hypothetical protein
MRRRHSGLRRSDALEDGDAATRLICVDVKENGESADLNRLSTCIRHVTNPFPRCYGSRPKLSAMNSLGWKEPRNDSLREDQTRIWA